MRFFYVLLVLQNVLSESETNDLGASVNAQNIVDMMIKLAKKDFNQVESDEDYFETFTNSVQNESFHVEGIMHMYNYAFNGLNNLFRKGDIVIYGNGSYFQIEFKCFIPSTKFTVYYELSFLDYLLVLSWSSFGRKEYRISNLVLNLKFTYDTYTHKIYLDDVMVEDVFKIQDGRIFYFGLNKNYTIPKREEVGFFVRFDKKERKKLYEFIRNTLMRMFKRFLYKINYTNI